MIRRLPIHHTVKDIHATIVNRYRDGSDYKTPCCETLVGDNMIGNVFGGNYQYMLLSKIVLPNNIITM